MNKPTLVVVEPDKHYIDTVARKAKKLGFIGDVVVVAEATPEALARALDSVADKTRMIIAKGMAETADFLRPILKYNDKELIVGGKDGLLSHCVILIKKMNWFGRIKPLILTDAAINIAPTSEQKVKITQNAINLARKMLGIVRPVVSMLTPAGKFNPAIKSSVDGDFVIKDLAWENAEVRLDQLDTALSPEARKIKKLVGEVADILVTDNLDSGNEIYKMHTMRAGYEAVGLVCGCSVPVVLTSRSDASSSKLLSIKYALRLLK